MSLKYSRRRSMVTARVAADPTPVFYLTILGLKSVLVGGGFRLRQYSLNQNLDSNLHDRPDFSFEQIFLEKHQSLI